MLGYSIKNFAIYQRNFGMVEDTLWLSKKDIKFEITATENP
jgi:hypothetical protein